MEMPLELWVEIFEGFTAFEVLASLALVSWNWKVICDSPLLWYKLCIKHFARQTHLRPPSDLDTYNERREWKIVFKECKDWHGILPSTSAPCCSDLFLPTAKMASSFGGTHILADQKLHSMAPLISFRDVSVT